MEHLRLHNYDTFTSPLISNTSTRDLNNELQSLDFQDKKEDLIKLLNRNINTVALTWDSLGITNAIKLRINLVGNSQPFFVPNI